MPRYCYVFHGPNIDNDPSEETVLFKDEPIEQCAEAIRQASNGRLVGYFSLSKVDGFESLDCAPLETLSE